MRKHKLTVTDGDVNAPTASDPSGHEQNSEVRCIRNRFAHQGWRELATAFSEFSVPNTSAPCTLNTTRGPRKKITSTLKQDRAKSRSCSRHSAVDSDDRLPDIDDEDDDSEEAVIAAEQSTPDWTSPFSQEQDIQPFSSPELIPESRIEHESFSPVQLFPEILSQDLWTSDAATICTNSPSPVEKSLKGSCWLESVTSLEQSSEQGRLTDAVPCFARSEAEPVKKITVVRGGLTESLEKILKQDRVSDTSVKNAAKDTLDTVALVLTEICDCAGPTLFKCRQDTGVQNLAVIPLALGEDLCVLLPQKVIRTFEIRINSSVYVQSPWQMLRVASPRMCVILSPSVVRVARRRDVLPDALTTFRWRCTCPRDPQPGLPCAGSAGSDPCSCDSWKSDSGSDGMT